MFSPQTGTSFDEDTRVDWPLEMIAMRNQKKVGDYFRNNQLQSQKRLCMEKLNDELGSERKQTKPIIVLASRIPFKIHVLHVNEPLTHSICWSAQPFCFERRLFMQRWPRDSSLATSNRNFFFSLSFQVRLDASRWLPFEWQSPPRALYEFHHSRCARKKSSELLSDRSAKVCLPMHKICRNPLCERSRKWGKKETPKPVAWHQTGNYDAMAVLRLTVGGELRVA